MRNFLWLARSFGTYSIDSPTLKLQPTTKQGYYQTNGTGRPDKSYKCLSTSAKKGMGEQKWLRLIVFTVTFYKTNPEKVLADDVLRKIRLRLVKIKQNFIVAQ